MQKHTKIYFDAFGYDKADYIASELSGEPATDLHHIDCRGMGGDPKGEKDRIENLMYLTRKEHDFYGEKKQYMFYLYCKHFVYLETHGVKFDKQWMIDQMAKYEAYAAEHVQKLEEVA